MYISMFYMDLAPWVAVTVFLIIVLLLIANSSKKTRLRTLTEDLVRVEDDLVKANDNAIDYLSEALVLENEVVELENNKVEEDAKWYVEEQQVPVTFYKTVKFKVRK